MASPFCVSENPSPVRQENSLYKHQCSISSSNPFGSFSVLSPCLFGSWTFVVGDNNTTDKVWKSREGWIIAFPQQRLLRLTPLDLFHIVSMPMCLRCWQSVLVSIVAGSATSALKACPKPPASRSDTARPFCWAGPRPGSLSVLLNGLSSSLGIERVCTGKPAVVCTEGSVAYGYVPTYMSLPQLWDLHPQKVSTP